MAPIDLLIIGSNNKSTGGIPRYIPEQVRHLPQSINPRVYDIGAPEGSGMLWFIRSLLLAIFDAVRFPMRSRPDIVHIHSSQDFSFYRASFYVLFAKYIWRVPVILHIHGSSFDEFVSTDSSAIQRLQSIVYKASSEIIVLSNYWKRQLKPYTDSSKIRIIPNAVNPNDYNPKYHVDPPHIIFISNLINRKGVDELVNSVRNILNDGARIRVSIAGKGPLSTKVETLQAEHESVEYLGYISEDEKYELLSNGSIYVLPAYAEGLPIAILEAMAGGNAIVSTTVGSIPEVIGEENGRLVSPKDPDQLSKELHGLIKSPETVKSMGKYNRQCVEERYCWSVVTEELVGCYENLIKTHA